MSSAEAPEKRRPSADLTPSRLTLARKRRGLTMAALAAACGVTPRTVTAWEAGAAHPSRDALKAMSTALAFPMDFFSGPDLDEVPLEGASFRSLSTMTARQRDRALAAGTLAFALSDWIDERFRVPPVDVPELLDVDPEIAADMLRATWHLGLKPISSMIRLLESHGVRVFSLKEETTRVDAFSVWRDTTPFVFLNTLKSAEHSRMDAAHELGHLVLHRGHGGPRGRECERQAQRFASAFLLPRESVIAVAPRSPSLQQLLVLKRPWKVSVSALLYRLNMLELLTEWRNRQLWIELSERGYRRFEPEGIPGETSQLLTKVFGALRNEGVSRAEIARQLKIEVEDLEALISHLVVVSLQGGSSRPTGASSQPSLRRIK